MGDFWQTLRDVGALYLWLYAGLLFFVAEAAGFRKKGCLFAGLAAFTTCALLYFNITRGNGIVAQFANFFAAGAVWTFLLWKPLRYTSHTLAHIIGETAYVGSSGLQKTSGGEVTWAGTIMEAKLAQNAIVDALEAGSQVTVAGIDGGTLVVTPKGH